MSCEGCPLGYPLCQTCRERLTAPGLLARECAGTALDDDAVPDVQESAAYADAWAEFDKLPVRVKDERTYKWRQGRWPSGARGWHDIFEERSCPPPAPVSYDIARKRFLDGQGAMWLAEMLEAVTIDEPDLDVIRAEPWPGDQPPQKQRCPALLKVVCAAGAASLILASVLAVPFLAFMGAPMFLISGVALLSWSAVRAMDEETY